MKKFPLLILPIFALFVTVFTANKEDTIETTLACMNETGATSEMISAYKPGDEKPSDEILCFIKCTFEKMGYVQEDGSVCVESMKRDTFPEGTDASREKVYQCLEKISKIASCEDAWPLEECFINSQ